MEVDEEEGISPSETKWESLLSGNDNDEYYTAVLELKNNIYYIKNAESRYKHSPKVWKRAWDSIWEDRDKDSERLLAVKVLT